MPEAASESRSVREEKTAADDAAAKPYAEVFHEAENRELRARLEARPAKDILDELWYGGYDYDGCEVDYGKAGEGYERWTEEERVWELGYETKIFGEPLPYVPFDAVQEIRSFRKLSPAKRRGERHRLKEMRELLQRQRSGMGELIRELYTAVTTAPDTDAAAIFEIVKRKASELRLTIDQLRCFKQAAEDYGRKHAAVERCRALYPDDGDLFAACFGRKPFGAVEVVKGPMTILFRCHDPKDFLLASFYDEYQWNESRITDDDRDSQDFVSGMALNLVGVVALRDTVTLEAAWKHKRVEVLKGVEKRVEVRGDKLIVLGLYSQRGDIFIGEGGEERWQMHVAERDRFGQPTRIQLLNIAERDPAPVFDVALLKPAEKRYWGAFLKNATGHDVGYVDMDYINLRIESRSPDGLSVRFYTDGIKELPDQEASKRTRAHEDQHQFNKLFKPMEMRLTYPEPHAAYWSEKNRNPKEIVRDLIRALLLQERRKMGYDAGARDETLAWYRGGAKTGEIYNVLTTSASYDYYKHNKERIERLPDELGGEISEKMSVVLYQAEPPTEADPDGYWNTIDAVPLTVMPEEIRGELGFVFKEQYRKDLQQWLKAMSLLEEKGYARDEIIAIMHQEPARNWFALARRLPPRAESALGAEKERAAAA